jgi:hypothetical protein
MRNPGSGRVRVASDVDVERAERALLDRIAGPLTTGILAGAIAKGTGERA